MNKTTIIPPHQSRKPIARFRSSSQHTMHIHTKARLMAILKANAASTTIFTSTLAIRPAPPARYFRQPHESRTSIYLRITGILSDDRPRREQGKDEHKRLRTSCVFKSRYRHDPQLTTALLSSSQSQQQRASDIRAEQFSSATCAKPQAEPLGRVNSSSPRLQLCHFWPLGPLNLP